MSLLSASPASRLFAPPPAGWSFSFFPDAAEGGGSFQSTYRPDRAYVAKGSGANPERAAAEAGRRARAAVRRYCAANRLNRLGTLTYRGAGCHDPRELRAHVGEFFRSLRDSLGDESFPYLWVPEWHKTDHGLHVHFAVGKFIRQQLIRSVWGRGHVHIKLLGDLPVGSGALSEARLAAGYLSKYVAKTFMEPEFRELGLHRYDVAEGFQPSKISLTGSTSAEVLDQASLVAGGSPSTQWSSLDVAGWSGPPAVWAQWGR